MGLVLNELEFSFRVLLNLGVDLPEYYRSIFSFFFFELIIVE